MKNLLAYTPEPFDNLEVENFEYAPLAGEMDMEEGEAWKRRPTVGRAPRRFPPVTRKARMIKPIRPKVRLGYPLVPRGGAAASLNVFPPTDDRRPSGQSSGSAGGEGNFGNAPAQDVSSEHIRWVQETLNRALGLRLIVDGIMNRETRSAVRMFQERKGLPVTGLVGPDTEEALRAEGGQAAAEPELLEGDWEMPDSGECSCGGREMEEFGELEGEAAPRVLTYTTKDVIDNRISVPAQHSLVRLSKKQATSADAVGLLEAVKSGRLLGIWCVNWKASSDRAQLHGFTWWDVIPKGEDAVLMLDPVNPLAGTPLIAFRRNLDTRPDKGCGMLPKKTTPSYLPQRLDAALLKTWDNFKKWQTENDRKTPPYCSAKLLKNPTAIARLKKSLNKILKFNLPVNGVWDTAAMRALSQYQKARHISISGKLDSASMLALNQDGFAFLSGCNPDCLIGIEFKVSMSDRQLSDTTAMMVMTIEEELRWLLGIAAKMKRVSTGYHLSLIMEDTEDGRYMIRLANGEWNYITRTVRENSADKYTADNKIADLENFRNWVVSRLSECHTIDIDTSVNAGNTAGMGSTIRLNPYTWFVRKNGTNWEYERNMLPKENASSWKATRRMGPLLLLLHEMEHFTGKKVDGTLLPNNKLSTTDDDYQIVADLDRYIAFHPLVAKREQYAVKPGWYTIMLSPRDVQIRTPTIMRPTIQAEWFRFPCEQELRQGIRNCPPII